MPAETTDRGAASPASTGTPRRGRRIVLACIGLALFGALLLAASWCASFELDLAPPGVLLGRRLERAGALTDGVAWRSSYKASTLRVFGADDIAAQDRIADAARRIVRDDRRMRRYQHLEIEFWTGNPDAVPTPESPTVFLRSVEIR